MQTRENDFFFYQTAGSEATITQYKNQGAIIQIPREVEQRPVTALGDYVFSGLPCEEIYIPKGVKKIGRYGFYNCTHLRHLSFHSDFMDLGSGAFTGCHKIRSLEVWMEQEESGLKEILSEIREELVVRLHGICEAVLWFPEYYEEGVENTPARILMTQVHGSGIYYRNCFNGKKFHFEEYDCRFPMARAQESRDFLLELTLGRLLHPYRLSETARADYETFLWEHYGEGLKLLIAGNREEELVRFLAEFPPGEGQKNSYGELLEYASQKSNPAVTSLLMETYRKRFPAKRKSFDL